MGRVLHPCKRGQLYSTNGFWPAETQLFSPDCSGTVELYTGLGSKIMSVGLERATVDGENPA